MSEENARAIAKLLKHGVEVKNKAPTYMNAVVGFGNLGYIIGLNVIEGKQLNVVLEVENSRALLKQTTIAMRIHSIFGLEPGGKEKNINLDVIGREVILTPNCKECRVISDHYAINGTLTLKEEPP